MSRQVVKEMKSYPQITQITQILNQLTQWKGLLPYSA